MSKIDEMQQAYDPKVLIEELKEQGLDVAEDGAAKIVKSCFKWVRKSAELSPNEIDDMVAPLLVPVEKYVNQQVDKIDGKVG